MVDALDAIAGEMRTANRIEALRLGSAALDDVDVTVIKTPSTASRQERLNRLRRGIREDLALDEGVSL